MKVYCILYSVSHEQFSRLEKIFDSFDKAYSFLIKTLQEEREYCSEFYFIKDTTIEDEFGSKYYIEEREVE